jgi:hypothetical protein
MADSAHVVKLLKSLAQLDIDVVRAYESAILRVDIPELRDQLLLFQGDHQGHVAELSAVLARLGSETPDATRDLRAFFLGGLAAARGTLGGMEGTLKSLRATLDAARAGYESALRDDLPLLARETAQRNLEELRMQIRFVDQAIALRVWESRRGDALFLRDSLM